MYNYHFLLFYIQNIKEKIYVWMLSNAPSKIPENLRQGQQNTVTIFLVYTHIFDNQQIFNQIQFPLVQLIDSLKTSQQYNNDTLYINVQLHMQY